MRTGTLQTLTPSTPLSSIKAPVAVEAGEAREPAAGAAVAGPRVAAIIVTWNRRGAVEVVLRALARQAGRAALDVVVVDNGSTDGTVEALTARWRPDAVFDNQTGAAHQPAFRKRSPERGNGQGDARGHAGNGGNAGAFASLTVVANSVNHGGCGGFNTGLAFAEQFLDRPGDALEYAWLVDDDVDLPDGALAQLVRTAEGDPEIGLVGSRTVDFDDRETTIETTIYFDHENGWMGPEPTPGHRLEAGHQRWVAEVGGTRGKLAFKGVREVDVVSACSLLARWSAVKKVGFWDHRYFIYCDDADWCLRFGKAGYKVVCDLDAVVFHTYWLSKLTPSRGYYAQRNLVWLIQKVLSGRRLRRSTLRRLGALLVESRKAMTHCRLFHAEIYRRTAHDIVTNKGGKLDFEEPPFIGLIEAMDAAGALAPEARVAVMCSHPESIRWADELRRRLGYALMDADRAAEGPRWVYMVRDCVPDPAPPAGAAAGDRPERVVFAANRGAKWEAQKGFLKEPPTAVIVFDQSNELPMIRARCNLHVDRRRPGMAQMEWDGWGPRWAFLKRWARTAILCALYAARVRPYTSRSKYG